MSKGKSAKTAASKSNKPKGTGGHPPAPLVETPGSGRLYRISSLAALNDPGQFAEADSLFLPGPLLEQALAEPRLDEVPLLSLEDLDLGQDCDGALIRFRDEAQVKAARELLTDGNLAVEINSRHDGLIAGECGADLLVLSRELPQEERAELTRWWADVVTLPLAVPITDPSEQRFWIELGADYTLLDL